MAQSPHAQPIGIDQVNQRRHEFAFRHGRGYIHAGPLPMPKTCLFDEKECVGPAVAPDGSIHLLQPPKGHSPIPMKWHPQTREWAPIHPAMGHRVTFRAVYLAAHGWKYAGQLASRNND